MNRFFSPYRIPPRFRRGAGVFAVLLAASAVLRAQETEWRFMGNRLLTGTELAAALTQAGVRYDPARGRTAMEKALQSRYALEGCYAATVDSIEAGPGGSARRLVTVFLTENERTEIGRIVFSGNAVFPAEKLLAEMESGAGQVFQPALLQKDVDALLSLYERSGYPFTRIALRDIAFVDTAGKEMLAISIAVEEGEKFEIREITVAGNSVTDADVILREARIKPGETFDAERVGEIRRRLEKLGFFSSVGEPLLYKRGSVGGLRIPVTEGNSNTFDGVIGYQPGRTSGESGYLTGLVRLSFRNLFGTGRRFDARWERASSTIQELELRYLEPWVLRLPVNLEGGFFQRQQDSTYVSRAADLQFSLFATNNIQLNLSGRSYSVIPSNGGAQLVGRSNTLSAGLELVIDSRDNVFAPTAGMLFRSGYSGGNKKHTPAGGEASTSYLQRLTVDASFFQSLLTGHVAALAVHGREVQGNGIDISDYYRVGGANSLRGYREEQFTGTRVAWANLEYRYLLTRRTFAFAFFDYGYLFSPAVPLLPVPEQTLWRRGFGLGIRIETPLGLMGVSYALGQGDSITGGKIHFGLVNDF